MQIRKEEIKLSLLGDDMFMYLKEKTKNLKKIFLMRRTKTEFRKVAGNKINIQKNQLYFYILAMNM